jgi:parallel beta-helix repeat protein
MPLKTGLPISRWFLGIAILLLRFTHAVSAATYYVSVEGNDNADGQSPDHPWRTLQRISQTGDVTQLLLERGCVWHETLTLTEPIAIGAYGQGPRPCIDGADAINASKIAATNMPRVFRAQMEGDPAAVWENNGPPLDEVKSREELTGKAGTFFYEKGFLYLHPANGSAEPFSGQLQFEIPTREVCIQINGSHIALRSIQICHAGRPDRGAISAWADGTLTGIELTDCDVSFNSGRGIWLCGTQGSSIHDVVIANNQFLDNDASGVLLVLADGAQVRGNQFSGNCRKPIEPWQAAIRVWSPGIRNLLISDNTIADQRWHLGDDSSMGIHCDETGDHVVIRDNIIRDVDESGIEVENTRGVTVEKNAISNCNIGILINRAGHDHIIRGNSISGSRAQGIAIQGWLAHGVNAGPEIQVQGRLMTRNLVENNRSTGSRLAELKAIVGGELIDPPLGNIYRDNDFGPERPGFIEWGDQLLDHYNQWPVPDGAIPQP